MRTSKLFGLLLAGLSLFALASCNDKEEDVLGFDQAKFLVAPDAIGETSATLIVSVTGNDNATWYGFLTTDTQTDAATVVKSKIAATSVTRHILNGSPLKKIEIDGLRKGGALYRYIVTGLLADGKIYGTPAEYVFETKGEFVANSVGTITYPNPVSEPTTVQFAGFPGTYVYGYFPKAEYSRAALKVKMNEDLATGDYDSADEDMTVIFPITEEGEYVVYAYELDGKGEPTLSCAEYDLVIDNLDFSAYEAFLGSWYINGIEGQTLTFTEKQRGVSYYVEGLPTVDLPLTLTTYEPAVATFNMATGILSFSEQDLSTFVISSYGDCMKSVQGTFVYGANTYGNYPGNGAAGVIFTAEIGEDGNIHTTPGNCEYGPYTSFRYAWYIMEGANAGKGNWSSEAIEFPLVLTKEFTPATDEFNAWIGTWYTPAGDEFTIAKDKTNASYVVSGLFGDFDIVTKFDAATGNMVFYGQKVGQDNAYTYYFYGIDQDDYIETGDPADNSLAVATLSGDGKSFDVQGCEYQATYSGILYDEIIVALQVFADNGSKYYGVGDPVALPAKFEDSEPVPSEAFLAWIGDWEVVRVPEQSHEATPDDVDAGLAENVGDLIIDVEEVKDVWTIAQKKMNSTYTITGIEGLTWAEVEATFDATDNSLNIVQQTVLQNDAITVSLLSEAEGGLVYNGYFGNICSGVIGLDGKATLTSASDYFVYGGKYYNLTVDGFHFYGITGEHVTIWNDTATPLPNVLTPYEGNLEVGAKGLNDNFKLTTPAVELPAYAVPAPANIIRKANGPQMHDGAPVSTADIRETKIR